jgi:hypothetical protein
METDDSTAEECLRRIDNEHLLEALQIANMRAKPSRQKLPEKMDVNIFHIVYSVPDEQFEWFKSALELRVKKAGLDTN